MNVVQYNQISQFRVGARTNFGEIRPDDTEWLNILTGIVSFLVYQQDSWGYKIKTNNLTLLWVHTQKKHRIVHKAPHGAQGALIQL